MVDRDDPTDRHRHVSHLFALYPGRQIAPDATPELAAAARKSLEARVVVHSSDPDVQKALQATDLPSLFIVSEVEVAAAPVGPESTELKGLSVKAREAKEKAASTCPFSN